MYLAKFLGLNQRDAQLAGLRLKKSSCPNVQISGASLDDMVQSPIGFRGMFVEISRFNEVNVEGGHRLD